MVQIRIDLSQEENRKITLYKVFKNHNTKADAIREIIRNLKVEYRK